VKKHLKKIVIGIAVAIAIGIGFLVVMFTEGSYIVYVPNK